MQIHQRDRSLCFLSRDGSPHLCDDIEILHADKSKARFLSSVSHTQEIRRSQKNHRSRRAVEGHHVGVSVHSDRTVHPHPCCHGICPTTLDCGQCAETSGQQLCPQSGFVRFFHEHHIPHGGTRFMPVGAFAHRCAMPLLNLHIPQHC